jgi:hypothetical protein
MVGGGHIKDQQPKKGLKKEFKTGSIKLPMQLCCKCGSVLCILPCQIIKWVPFKDSKWSLAQNLDFLRGPRLFWPLKWPSLSLVPFKGPKKSRAPQKVSILCRDHLESLNWTHLMIWQGRIHNTTPHLQHRCINS